MDPFDGEARWSPRELGELRGLSTPWWLISQEAFHCNRAFPFVNMLGSSLLFNATPALNGPLKFMSQWKEVFIARKPHSFSNTPLPTQCFLT